MAPKGIPIPGTWECYLIRQRDFADVIQVFRWGGYPGLFGRAERDHLGL